MRIITISRQFGSGGRELGRRLAEILGWDYYDKAIIERLCDEKGLDADYAARMLHGRELEQLSRTDHNSFAQIGANSNWQLSLLSEERRIIEEIAALGRDCIIVGRDADVILRDEHPFRIYVCADEAFRVQRCLRHEEKKPTEERLTERQIRRNIRALDRSRIRTREILTGQNGRDCSLFELTVNAASWETGALAEVLANTAKEWFAR